MESIDRIKRNNELIRWTSSILKSIDGNYASNREQMFYHKVNQMNPRWQNFAVESLNVNRFQNNVGILIIKLKIDRLRNILNHENDTLAAGHEFPKDKAMENNQKKDSLVSEINDMLKGNYVFGNSHDYPFYDFLETIDEFAYLFEKLAQGLENIRSIKDHRNVSAVIINDNLIRYLEEIILMFAQILEKKTKIKWKPSKREDLLTTIKYARGREEDKYEIPKKDLNRIELLYKEFLSGSNNSFISMIAGLVRQSTDFLENIEARNEEMSDQLYTIEVLSFLEGIKRTLDVIFSKLGIAKTKKFWLFTQDINPNEIKQTLAVDYQGTINRENTRQQQEQNHKENLRRLEEQSKAEAKAFAEQQRRDNFNRRASTIDHQEELRRLEERNQAERELGQTMDINRTRREMEGGSDIPIPSEDALAPGFELDHTTAGEGIRDISASNDSIIPQQPSDNEVAQGLNHITSTEQKPAIEDESTVSPEETPIQAPRREPQEPIKKKKRSFGDWIRGRHPPDPKSINFANPSISPEKIKEAAARKKREEQRERVQNTHTNTTGSFLKQSDITMMVPIPSEDQELSKLVQNPDIRAVMLLHNNPKQILQKVNQRKYNQFISSLRKIQQSIDTHQKGMIYFEGEIYDNNYSQYYILEALKKDISKFIDCLNSNEENPSYEPSINYLNYYNRQE